MGYVKRSNGYARTLWQAWITAYYDPFRAEMIGNAHENLSFTQESSTIWENYSFKEEWEADRAVDVLNNRIGRKLGETEKK